VLFEVASPSGSVTGFPLLLQLLVEQRLIASTLGIGLRDSQ
jgi:hypothetical protein